ncbi:MAG: hypothetical protein C4551_10265 [Bacillota bacterium]|jgi:hypothetical protein|nr:MAG: hypothetical protein C4551_10265 [Bacillota bacterium]
MATDLKRIYVARSLDEAISEAAFQMQVEELLDLTGWLHHHAHDSRRSDSGLPDLIAVRPPRALFLELKTQRGRLRKGHQPGDIVRRPDGTRRVVRRFEPGQVEWIEALRACPGVETWVFRPSDWPRIVEILNDGRIAVD